MAQANSRSAARRFFSLAATGSLGAFALGAGLGGFHVGRKLLRGGPPPVWLPLEPGVSYDRRVVAEPRRAAIHRIVIDLSASTLEIVVTPAERDAQLPYLARTTGEFLERQQLLAAINGDYFAPWHCNNPIDYSPKRGEPVFALGPAAFRGAACLPHEPGYYARRCKDCTWYFGADNRVTLTPSGPLCSAISGGPVLVRDGLPAGLLRSKVNPQTALALERDGKRLWMVVVDGRQPGFSEGLTDWELANWLIQAGAWQALRLDGGGSSTMAIRSPRGRARVVNSPIHAGIPGWQRPVANHFGIRIVG